MTSTSLSLEEDTLRRLDELVMRLPARPDLIATSKSGAPRLSRSAALRLVIQRGVEAVEAELSRANGGGR